MSSLADRVWYAIHCLPRGDGGSPPAFLDIEERAKLPNALLSKMVRGKRKAPSAKTMACLAEALCVDANWLIFGTGAAPTLTGELRPRPGSEDVPAWRPGSAMLVHQPHAHDVESDQYPSRAIVVAMARAHGGLDGPIAALLAESPDGKPDTEEYWHGRLLDHIRNAKRMQAAINAPTRPASPDTDVVAGRQGRAG